MNTFLWKDKINKEFIRSNLEKSLKANVLYASFYPIIAAAKCGQIFPNWKILEQTQHLHYINPIQIQIQTHKKKKKKLIQFL